MNALKRRIMGLIETTGPMSVADYMALCLFDPEHGYYTTREPFGAAGDFTTAPEISQMFGEILAIWLYSAWGALGCPKPATLAEIGPGRGTLMKDMLRTLGRLDADFLRHMRVVMLETSPRLVKTQQHALAGAGVEIRWAGRVAELTGEPLFIVGNELFDAVPVRQYVKTGHGWRERVVAVDGDGLALRAGPGGIDPALLPPGAASAPTDSLAEFAPARTAMMEEIAGHVASHGGAGLFIDYGYAEPSLGDTLQAVRRHEYDDMLAHPGEADVTAHVDFSALSTVARSHGLTPGLMEQGEFLLAMGLLERAGRLGAGRGEAEQERIRSEVERLAGPDAMGRLFKVLAIIPSGATVFPF